VQNVIKQKRAERGISQAALAEALGVSRQTVNAIETGRYMPSLPLAFGLARFFETPIEGLFDPGEEIHDE
jgi:putative transcriptional regulator